MNLRLTLVLVTALLMVAGYVGFVELKKPSTKADVAPYFYNVSMDAIKVVNVSYAGTTMKFKYDKDTQHWVFDDGQKTPVNNDRWSGITLLLSGPRVSRILKDTIEDSELPTYGLDKPSGEIDVGLEDGRSFQIFLGARTPDGQNYYSIRKGSPQVALLNSSWGEVIIRLVQEPPYLPTPVVTPCPTLASTTPTAPTTPQPTPTLCGKLTVTPAS